MMMPSAWSMTARLTSAACRFAASRLAWASTWAFSTAMAAGVENSSPTAMEWSSKAPLPLA